MPKTRATATRSTCTPDTWIEAATEVLVDQGVDRVRVDVLAQELGMTWGGSWSSLQDYGHIELRRPGLVKRAGA